MRAISTFAPKYKLPIYEEIFHHPRGLPCGRFQKDPTISDEQNQANLEKMVANLKKVAGKEE